jgi:hypothetical protein
MVGNNNTREPFLSLKQVKLFREGKYDQAEESLQRKWKYIMLYLLPKVCHSLPKKIEKITKNYSEKDSGVTISDEAYLFFLLIQMDSSIQDETDMSDLTPPEEEEDHKDNEKGKKRKFTQVSKKNTTSKKFKLYQTIFDVVKKNRKKSSDSTTWDKALQDEAILIEGEAQLKSDKNKIDNIKAVMGQEKVVEKKDHVAWDHEDADHNFWGRTVTDVKTEEEEFKVEEV